MRKVIPILLAVLIIGCGDDDGSTSDIIDGSPDAPTADAGVCGTDFEYQIEVFDWADDVAVLASTGAPATVTLTEVGNDSNTSTVAPNGRAILCLTDDTSQVRFDSSAHKTRIEVVHRSAYDEFLELESAESYRVYLLDQADLDTLSGDAASTDNSHILIDVRGDSGVMITLSAASDASKIGSAPGPFAAGTSTTPTDTVFAFTNAQPASEVTWTGPLCTTPNTLPAPADTVVGTLVSCFFGP
ncbi:MAG: hypothetical protein KJO07_05145 [Deltaproteobacteria bacterium]|nr:hypothetical protein [Deltaproteobacteria bacterium]